MEKKSHTMLWKGYVGAEGACGGMAGLLGAMVLQVKHDSFDLVRSAM